MAERSRWSEALAERLPGLAASDQPVLIIGEVGTGRATLAFRIHDESGRRSGPRQPVFGAEANAALLAARHAALGGGTLVLRDLELLSPPAQAELVRLLDAAGTTRLIATATPFVRECVAGGRLRADLWRRLQVHRVDLPPLRERMSDLPGLVESMLPKAVDQMPPSLSLEAKAALCSYCWWLNLQELKESLVQASTAAGPGRPIDLQHLPPEVCRAYHESRGESIYDRFQNAVERTMLQWALESGKNKVELSTILGLSRAGLYKRLKKHGLLDESRGNKNPRRR